MKRRSEVALVEAIRKRAGSIRNSRIIESIGDDCAIFRPAAREDLVFTTDYLIEDVHFSRGLSTPEEVGHKTLARGLSDIAAMGATPQFALLSLALAPWTDDRWVNRFFSGLLRLARQWKTPLAGGDLSHTGKLTADIIVCGSVPRGQALRRDGARVGDSIWVSGRLGKPWQRHPRPRPRIDVGLAIRGRATSAMDLTDGLALDLFRLLTASGAAAELDRVPVVRGSTVEQALYGGEDYQLLFTLPGAVAAPPGCFRIGVIAHGKPGSIRFNGAPVTIRGYDHFSSSPSA